MIVNEFGQVAVSEHEALEALYSNSELLFESLFFYEEDVVNDFNRSIEENADLIPHIKLLEKSSISLDDFDKKNQSNWFMPENYCTDLIEKLYEMCDTDVKRERVTQELELFLQYNMITLLHYLKYLVDTMRSHKIVWGVGRGSSVSSYILYLIGVHKIDSIKYNLDIREFLK
mgnify:CR=1 FL=1